LVLVHQKQNPVYRSIIDQLIELIRKWKEREINYQELLKEENEIIKVIETQDEERKSLDLNQFDFGLFLILRDFLKEKNEGEFKTFIKDMKDLIEEDLIENWQENPTLKQNIERKIREYLLQLKQKYSLSYEEFDSLHKKIITFINDYGS